MTKSFVPPSVIKQKARQVKKETSLSQHKALDAAAASFGFANYKNYVNEAKENRIQKEVLKQSAMDAMSDQRQDEISKRIALTDTMIQNSRFSAAALIDILKHSSLSKTKVQTMCNDQPFFKTHLQLLIFKDVLQDESCEINEYAPYHAPKAVLLKDLYYSFKDESLFVEGNYDLILEFAFDHDPIDTHPTFEDDEMSGSFELSIDREMHVEFEDGSIGVGG